MRGEEAELKAGAVEGRDRMKIEEQKDERADERRCTCKEKESKTRRTPNLHLILQSTNRRVLSAAGTGHLIPPS